MLGRAKLFFGGLALMLIDCIEVAVAIIAVFVVLSWVAA